MTYSEIAIRRDERAKCVAFIRGIITPESLAQHPEFDGLVLPLTVLADGIEHVGRMLYGAAPSEPIGILNCKPKEE